MNARLIVNDCALSVSGPVLGRVAASPLGERILVFFAEQAVDLGGGLVWQPAGGRLG